MNDELLAMIEEEVSYIEDSFKPFFEKHGLVLKEKSPDPIIYGNDIFELRFHYEHRYRPMMFGGLQLVFPSEDRIFGFRDIINHMQYEWGLPDIDTYKVLSTFKKDYLPYLQSHVEPFLKSPESQDKLVDWYNAIYRKKK